jgi:hypothetical protein
MYGLRYTTQAFSKSNKLYTAYIYEKDYSGPVDNIAAGFRPFEHNVLASSDDPFEPILASDLTEMLDITDFTGAIPDLTTRDDKKYHIKLKAGAAPDYNQSIILWKNYETSSPEVLDCNFQIYVNGQSQVFEFFNNTGEFQVNATDTVRLECAVFSTPSGLPIVGAGWRLIVKEDGTTIFDTTDQDPTLPSAINYTFVAGYQKVYTVLCYSYQIGDDSTTIPVNTIYDIFQGFLLTDSANLRFSTGRIDLQLPFTDGLGMLKSIPYEQNYATPAVSTQNGAVLVDINTTQTLLDIVLQCLNKLELPDNFYINIACNIYAIGMDEDISSFEQAEYYRRNWQNADLTWMSCYDVLQTICKSFGAQIFQAANEYWIVNIEERAAGSLRYFKYDHTGALEGLYNNDPTRTIVPYTDTAYHYFVDNGQRKIIRKGYPIIEIKSPFEYAPNLIDNGNLRRVPVATDEIAYNWRKSVPTLGSMGTAEIDGTFYIEMSTGASAATTSIRPLSVANVFQDDKITISFDYRDTVSAPTTNPILQMRCEIYEYGGSGYYQLNQDRDWKTFVPSPPNYIWVDITSGGTYLSGKQSQSISLPRSPVNGNIYLEFRINNPSTQLQATVGNFSMKFDTNNNYKEARGYYDFLSQYKRTQEMQLGMQPYCYSQVGALLRANAIEPSQPSVWSSWYKFGTAVTFLNLPRLILQQYINIQSAAQVNMDGTIMSIFSNNGPITLISAFEVQDTTARLPVANTKFILGNARVNYTDDTIQATWLQINETEITESITDIIIQK